jgi:hypothetical protein
MGKKEGGLRSEAGRKIDEGVGSRQCSQLVGVADRHSTTSKYCDL